MKYTYSLLFLSILSICLHGQIKEGQLIDQVFTEWDKPDVPGCALGIIKDAELVYARGYGLANMEYAIPNSASSVFRIGSTSKQFTAACIVLLEKQGKLKLDDDLKSIFPDFPDYTENITIRHLLNHTSGIRDYLMISYLKGMGEDDYYEDEDIMKWLINQSDLNFNPGEEYLYSNSGYWLLGQIVGKVSGKNMADFAKEEIFEPLGMKSTHFHNDHTQIVKNRASGYVPGTKNRYKISMTTLDMIGDGGIFTCIEDIKKWDDAYYHSRVLSREFWDVMTQQGVLNNGEVIDYAAGLSIGNYKGLKTIRHGGAFVGFRAELLRFPDQQLSIAVFANRGDANPSVKANQVADILLKDFFENNDMEAQMSGNGSQSSFVSLNSEELENFSGHYWNEGDSYSRRIYVRDDTLRYQRSENSESALLALEKKKFKMINVGVDLVINFKENQSGDEIMEVIIDGGTPIISKKYQPKDYTTKELIQFEGSYYSKELDVEYKLIMENELLMLYIDDQKKSPVKSVMPNLLSNDNYGIFHFIDAKSGKVKGFRMSAGRVKNLFFEKK